MSKAQARIQVSSTNALYAVHLSEVGWDCAVIACPDAAIFRLLARRSEDDPGTALEVRACPVDTLVGNPAVLLYLVANPPFPHPLSRSSSRAPAAPLPPQSLRKPRTSAATASGCSRCARWPAPSSSSTREPAMRLPNSR